MGWLRQNWLDAIIFLLVAVIMAGVIFFLTGVNPFKRDSRPAVVGAPTTQVAQPAPSNTSANAAPKASTSSPKPTAPSTTSSKAQDPTAPTNALPVVTVIPEAPSEDVVKPVAKPASNPPSAAKPTPAKPISTPVPSKSAPKPSAPVKAEKLNPVRSSPDAEADGTYRVVVGSFSKSDNADRLVATLKSQGYPVSTESDANVTRVWVGPYSQTKAETVTRDLSKYGAATRQIPTKTTPASTTPTATVAESETPATPSNPVVAKTPSVYLQIGAFGKRENADAAAQTARELGFAPSIVEANGVFRVRVGPVEDQAKATSTLKSKGFDVVVVR